MSRLATEPDENVLMYGEVPGVPLVGATSGSLSSLDVDDDDDFDGPDGLYRPDLPASHTSSQLGMSQKKRRRIPVNCQFCRQRKQKCDRKMPCSNCIRRNNSRCVYPEGRSGSTTSPTNATLGEQEELAEHFGMTALPANAEQLNLGKIMTMDNFLSSRLARGAQSGSSPNVPYGSEMKQRLDKMENLVLSLLTQREEAAKRSTLDEVHTVEGPDGELDDLNDSLGMLKLDKKGKSVYHGDTHWGFMFSEITQIQDVLRKIREEFDSAELFGRQRFESLCQISDGQQDTSNIPFGGVQFRSSSHDVLKTLPPRHICNLLIDRYFDAIQPVCYIVHQPSFQIQYDEFWRDSEKTELLWVSQLLGMISLALQSYAPNEVPEYFKGKVVESWNSWLSSMELCGFMGKLTFKPSLLNIRVLLLWMLLESYMSDWNHKSWTSMGVLVRVAHSMGMHRDPSWFVLSPFEMEERRRMWKLIEYFDGFHSICQGLPLGIRRSENDVKPLSNINDLDIMPDFGHYADPQDISRKTDSTFMMMRAQMSEFQRDAFSKNLKIEGTVDSMSLDELWKLDSDIRKLYNSFPDYLKMRADDSSPADNPEIVIQRFMLEIDYWRTIVVLHRSFSSSGVKNPKYQRNREEALNASINILERYHWLYMSPAAETVRMRFWLVTSSLTFSLFMHACLFVAVALMNKYEDFSVSERTRYVDAVRRCTSILDSAGTTISCDFRQASIAKLLIKQIDELTEMSPEARRKHLRRGDEAEFYFEPSQAGKNPKGIMMELDARDAEMTVDALGSNEYGWSNSTDFSPESLNTTSTTTSAREDGTSAYGAASTSATAPTGMTPGAVDFSEALFGDSFKMQQIVGTEEWEYFMQGMEGTTPVVQGPAV